MTSYVYRQMATNPDVYAVGFYDPNGEFHVEAADADFASAPDAAWRVHFLNGGSAARDPAQPGTAR